MSDTPEVAMTDSEVAFWERHDPDYLWRPLLQSVALVGCVVVAVVGGLWLLLHDSPVALGLAESADRRCADHGGVASTGGRGPDVVTCKDGTAHSLPVWISREEWENR